MPCSFANRLAAGEAKTLPDFSVIASGACGASISSYTSPIAVITAMGASTGASLPSATRILANTPEVGASKS